MKIGRQWRVLVIALISLGLGGIQAYTQPFQYSISNNEVTITGYTYDGILDAKVPSQILGLPVTAIGDSAFNSPGGFLLNSVTIPSSVTRMGANVFSGGCSGLWGCPSLKSIIVDPQNPVFSSSNGVMFDKTQSVLLFYPPGLIISYFVPTNVTAVGAAAFANTLVKSVTIPDSVTSIGERAFSGCSASTVSIGKGVTDIGDSAFVYCGALKAIRVDPLNAAFSSVGGVLFNKTAAELVFAPPASMTNSYSVPTGVISIHDAAFYFCSALRSVSMPSTVTSVGSSAFYFCGNLTNINIPNGVQNIGDSAFEQTALTQITIPDSVTNIGSKAFHGCSGLASANLGNGLASIGPGAFESCTSLVAITIPDSVTSIGAGAFDCPNLKTIAVGPQNGAYSSSDGVLFTKNQSTLVQYPEGIAGDYIIPAGVTSIGVQAFSGCVGLTNVTIPSSLNLIGDGAFAACSSLSNVTIPSGVTNVGSSAFAWCGKLTNVIFGNAVTSGKNPISIGSNAFYTSGLTTLVIGNATSIGDSAFSSCHGLRSVILGDGTTSIGALAFSGCSSLTRIDIPESVTTIGNSAFSSCVSLPNVVIPDSVIDIEDEAFSSCSSLTNVIVGNSVALIGRFLFNYCPGLTGIYFRGNAPIVDELLFGLGQTVVATVYYLPGTLGWTNQYYYGRPVSPWLSPSPLILTSPQNFGVASNLYGFRISWATNVPVVVEASTTLVDPIWSSVSTNSLVDGWADFSDPDWTNHPVRFYRVRQQ